MVDRILHPQLANQLAEPTGHSAIPGPRRLHVTTSLGLDIAFGPMIVDT